MRKQLERITVLTLAFLLVCSVSFVAGFYYESTRSANVATEGQPEEGPISRR